MSAKSFFGWSALGMEAAAARDGVRARLNALRPVAGGGAIPLAALAYARAASSDDQPFRRTGPPFRPPEPRFDLYLAAASLGLIAAAAALALALARLL